LLLLVLLIGLVSVTGCKDDDDDENPLVGTWKMQSEDGEVLPAGASVTLVLSGDNTYKVTMTFEGVTEVETGSYSVAGSVLTVNPSDDEPDAMTYVLSGNTLTLTGSEGEILVFNKQ